MTDVGIFDGDILVADRARTLRSGDIVIADIHDMRVVKRLRVSKGVCVLAAEAKGHSPMTVDPDQGVKIMGVVVHTIHTC